MKILPLVFATLISCPGASAANGDPEIIYITKGEAAPFAGDLFPPYRSARMGVLLDTCAERREIEVKHAQDLAKIEMKRQADLHRANLDAEQKKRELLQAELDRATAWYRSPAFVAGGTAVVAIGVVVLSVVVLNAAADINVTGGR